MTFGLVPLLKKSLAMDARSMRFCVLYGILNSVIVPLLWFTGLKYTSAINASMLSATDVVFYLILSQLFVGEKMTRMQFLGLSTVIMGILVMNFPSVTGTSAQIGDLYIVVGCFASASGTLVFKKYLPHVMPELAIAIRNIAAIITVSIIAIVINVSVVDEVAVFPQHKLLLLLAFTFFSRYLNLSFFYEALQRLPGTTLSLIQAATPLSGLVFAYLLLGETITTGQAMGCVIIIGGLVIENLSPKAVGSLHFFHSMISHLSLKKRAVPQTDIHNPLVLRNI